MADEAKRSHRLEIARSTIADYLDTNLAASRVELEAKLIDSHLGNPPFEPTHLHDALRLLLRAGTIRVDHTTTRGGSAPPIIVITASANRSRRIKDAMARKRLVMSRYYSYVQGGVDAGESLAGPAGERAFDAALGRARIGASIATLFRDLPSVPVVFGDPVPLGPLDNGFVISPLDSTTKAPKGPYGVTAVVEVKNIRQWVYPRTQELYQLLVKGSEIQAAHPEHPVLPVLVCRRAHFTTRKMAKDLGFFVIEARRQYLPESSLIEAPLLEELRLELGIADLVQGTDSTAQTEKKLVTLQQFYDLETATRRWSDFSDDPELRQCFYILHNDEISSTAREETLNRVRRIVQGDADQFSW